MSLFPTTKLGAQRVESTLRRQRPIRFRDEIPLSDAIVVDRSRVNRIVLKGTVAVG